MNTDTHSHRQLWNQVGIIACLILALATLGLGRVLLTRQDRMILKTPSNSQAVNLLPGATQRGVWQWQRPQDISPEQADSDLQFMRNHQLNTLYVDVSDYLTAYELPDETAKQQRITELQTSLKDLVRKASASGIAVHALAGDTHWGFASHAYIPLLFVDFVHNYNLSTAEDERLQGLQFDIEIHNDDQFLPDSKGALTQYLQSVQSTVEHYQAQGDNFWLGYTMPYWYDNENGNLPEITYNKKSAPIAYHLFDILAQLPQPYVVVMDYRNTVEGSDGSVAHAQNELVYTSQKVKRVKVVIGQETTDVEPRKITFHDKKPEDLNVALQRLAKSFEGFDSFYGIAIHDLDGYRTLTQKGNDHGR